MDAKRGKNRLCAARIEHARMSGGNPALIKFVRDEIVRDGPIPFRRFMEQALYHPQHGYYSSGHAIVGRDGDFFTNVSVGPLFGKLLAGQFVEMWEHLGQPDEFTIVEQGANNGDFAKDVLSAAKNDAPDFFVALRYVMVEPVDFLREKQRESLVGYSEKVAWSDSVTNLDPFCGVHFSNELLDAMPVHLINWRGEWREVCVDWNGHGFKFVEQPLANEALQLHLQKIAPPPIDDYQTEVNIDALVWISELAEKLTRGFVLIVDYGYPRGIYYSPERIDGTLACYSRHHRIDDPLQNIGETDITAHVDFTSVAERAEELCLSIAGFTDQHHFIVGLAKNAFRDYSETNLPDPKTMRAFNTLMHPDLLGRNFKILALQKNVALEKPLRGFEFASDPRQIL